MISRRKALKTMAGVPLGTIAMEGLAGSSALAALPPSGSRGIAADVDRVPNPEIYRAIGVEPVINCRGTFTIIGGSVHRPEVGIAMEEAAQSFVQLDELATGVGQRLADLTGAEWGVVTAGCAAAMKHVTAACVTGGNPEKLQRIPDLTGFDKTEVVIPRYSRNSYDHAIRNIGVRVITVESLEELENALNSRTAMCYLTTGDAYDSGPMSIDNVVQVTRPRNVPVIVDAAAEILTIPNVHLRRGATVVLYSGGKVLCGPQCAGLALGDKSILLSTWQASSPHHGPGRDNKIGREETMGMLAAVEAWIRRDHDAEWRTYLSWLDLIQRRLEAIPALEFEIHEPEGLNNRSPRLDVYWDPGRLHVTGEEIAEEVGSTPPRIALQGRGESSDRTSISITAFQMQPGNAQIVADRLHEVLSRSRSPKSTTMAAPAADLTGRWVASIRFYSSESEQTLTIERQDGNWLQGSHQADFATRDMVGTIEGSNVTLRSSESRPGNSLAYVFTGTLSGDTISGRIHMGEYLEAAFEAVRHSYPDRRTPIRVLNGPPLAT
jgi:D-glucosaminate-6-phosphate ammonia-lyase